MAGHIQWLGILKGGDAVAFKVMTSSSSCADTSSAAMFTIWISILSVSTWDQMWCRGEDVLCDCTMVALAFNKGIKKVRAVRQEV